MLGTRSSCTLLLAYLALAASACAFEIADEERPSGSGPVTTEGQAQALTLTGFTDKYVNYNQYYVNCSGNGFYQPGPHGDIKGYEPQDAGTYPVFIFLVGTFAPWDSVVDESTIQYMASKGFVAATVEYDNGAYPATCTRLEKKAECVFNESSARSAVSKLCARSKADCEGKGIYVSGHSQGAHQASLAANYGTHYKAAYLVGNGTKATCGSFPPDLSACLVKSNLSFASSQIRSISAENDECFGVNQSGVQTQLQDSTGVTCAAGTYDCLQADGSGWLMVRHSEQQDGHADHCHMSNGGCSSYTTLDTGWSGGTTASWQLRPNLDWLAAQ